MRALWGLLLFSFFPPESLTGAVLNGVVLEYGSGLPLARSQVTLQRVTSTGVIPGQTMVSGRSGGFQFLDLEPGDYLVSAVRDTYAVAIHGQRRPDGFGRPLRVTAEKAVFAELQLRKLGVITGRVVDENTIGIAGVPVIAYTAGRPVRPVKQGLSDDRGAFRIHSLPPGEYFVRTAPQTLSDQTTVLPTYSPESVSNRDARQYAATLANETPYADIRAIFGSLTQLNIGVVCANPAEPVTVTIASDSLRRRASAGCNTAVDFAGLPPGQYEIYAETHSGLQSAHQFQTLGRQSNRMTLELVRTDMVQFDVRPPESKVNFKLRRVDLYGEDIEQTYKERRFPLPRGGYELSVLTASGEYPARVSGIREENTHPDWYFLREGNLRVQVEISAKAGALRGQVTQDGDPVAAAPVFAAPVRAETRRALNGTRRILTGSDGRFLFTGLPPGEYLLLSSLDYQQVTNELLQRAGAVTVVVGESATAGVSLVLYQAP